MEQESKEERPNRKLSFDERTISKKPVKELIAVMKGYQNYDKPLKVHERLPPLLVEFDTDGLSHRKAEKVEKSMVNGFFNKSEKIAGPAT
jgi:hypothetical protein